VTPELAFLRYNYRGIAWVRRNGAVIEVTICPYRGTEVRGRAGSIRQGMRHVERWVSARTTWV
jgi:hypothetical protein